MENEKFDKDLRSALLAHEETATPVFDKERAWRKSHQNNRRKAIWASVVAAAFILALAFALQIGQLPAEKSIAVSPHKLTGPVKSVKADAGLNDRNKTIIKQVTVNDHKTTNIAETMATDTASVVPALPTAAPILAVQAPEPQSADTLNNVKVTFKRGKMPEEPSPGVSITFSKGKALNFKWKQIPPLTDSVYYTNATIFKLKFKP